MRLVAGETGHLDVAEEGHLDLEAVRFGALVGLDFGEPVADDGLVVEEAVGLEL